MRAQSIISASMRRAMLDPVECGTAFALQLVLFLHERGPKSALVVRWNGRRATLRSGSARGDPSDVDEYGGETVEITLGNRHSDVVGSRTAFEFLKQLAWIAEPRVSFENATLADFYEFEHVRAPADDSRVLTLQGFARALDDNDVRRLRGMEIPNRAREFTA